MISAILLVLTIILLVIGAIFGFWRGILKQGVRIVLWGVLFAVSCFFIPQITDKLPVLIAERFEINAVDVNNLVTELLNKIEFLKNETYLIVPLSGMVRTLFVPVITIALFWISGLASWLLYLIVALFLRKATEKQGVFSELGGMILGIFFALICGGITIFPLASVSKALQEGDYEQTLSKEFEIAETLEKSYEGAPVQKVYQFTGTEWLSKTIHNKLNASVVSAEEHNIWSEMPNLVRFGSEGWQMYSAVSSATMESGAIKEQIEQIANTYFSLNFISDENQLLLLNRLKTSLETSVGDELVSNLFNWLQIQSKEQLINDIVVYVDVYEILNQEGILNTSSDENLKPVLTEEVGSAVVNTLYELSNAEVVIPEFINLLYSAVVPDAAEKLIRTEHLEWNEQTKEDISEVVSFTFEIADLLLKKDSMTLEEKMNVLEKLKTMESNSVIENETLMELVDRFAIAS